MNERKKDPEKLKCLGCKKMSSFISGKKKKKKVKAANLNISVKKQGGGTEI